MAHFVTKISDIIEFNPRETIARKQVCKKVPMEYLQPFTRQISGFEEAPYAGGTKFRNNDTIMARITPCLENGKTAFVKGFAENEVVFGSTEYIVMRAIPGASDPVFIYYLATSPSFREVAIKSMVGSSGRQRVQQDVLENLELVLPDYETQVRVGKVLSAFDDKIELNTQINHNLEEQAKAIFDDMFPGITDGDSCVGDIITPKRGKSLLSKDAVPGDVPVIAGGLEPATFHNVSNTTPPVLTISASGANAGYVSLWTIPVWSSDSSFIDSSMTGNVYFWYVLLKKRQKEIFDAQTGSAQPHIYPQHIAQMSLANISKQDIEAFTNTVKPIFDTIGENKKQNKRLAQLRDTLLPKLMSGEIDVSEVEI